ncbi:hypothetical protein Cgig2_000020 [Carnegiea gigantea]|uniref:Uncharacterized protein n=1 Tax=Carnegiea gigantea TaxID=171969 RepID=A0A9Q1QSY7_9CARY|nr:hypothetical protein Cgig2_000020 [Carnegiea gigantea]
MAFPHSLNTKKMAEYVVRHFACDRRGIAFPLSPLPKDFLALCPSYELAVAEEAAEDYVIFYAMLLNEAERLGVLHGQALRALNTFESWVWLYGDRIFEAQFRMKAAPEESSGAGLQEEGSEVELEGEGSAREGAASPSDDGKQGSDATGKEGRQRTIGTLIFPFIMAFPPLYNTREMVNYVRESFIWRRRRATRPPHPLPEDYYVLYPRFLLPEPEGAAADFKLPEMVQATFYAMLLNEAMELGVVHGFMAEGLRSALVGLRWSNFEVWMSRVDHELREAVTGKARDPSNGFQVTGAMWRGRGGPLLLRELYLPRHREKREKLKMNLFPNFASTEQVAEYVRHHFRCPLRDPSDPGPRPLPSEYLGVCPRFDLGVATRYGLDSNTPEIVQIIFYAIVIDNAAELGFSRRLIVDCVIRAVRKLDWGPVEAWLEDNG